MKTLVLVANSHCPHGRALKMGETQCSQCKWENYVLSLRPPFDVKCVDDKDIDLNKGSKYTVVATIIEGVLPNTKTVYPCFLLETKNGQPSNGYDFRRFEPV